MDAVPSPHAGVDTFEKLMKQSDFKDYLTRNLDSEYLISSILADDIDGDAFVEGIEQYRSLTPILRESLINRINNFELATTAGIDVSIHMTISFFVQLTSADLTTKRSYFTGNPTSPSQPHLVFLTYPYIHIDMSH